MDLLIGHTNQNDYCGSWMPNSFQIILYFNLNRFSLLIIFDPTLYNTHSDLLYWFTYSYFLLFNACIVEPDAFQLKSKNQMGRYELVLQIHPVAQRKKKLGLFIISKPNRKNCHILPQNTKEKWHFQLL